MFIFITRILITLLLFLAIKTAFAAPRGGSFAGRRTLLKLFRRRDRQADLWASPLLKRLTILAARAVRLDESTEIRLRRDLEKAGLSLTPQAYTARKYLITAAGLLFSALYVVACFYFGALITALGTVFALMRHRDTLNARIRRQEGAIAGELPRFVRSVCRSLQSSRDLETVFGTYRKVAGPELGGELDILLAEMRSGNIQTALLHFENRLGTPEASRLCAALRGMSLGIDQTATLNYLADDMAQKAKENIRRELSLRPGKMRRTYYPAIGVCIAMILYVLVVYVVHNLNSIV